MLKTEGPFEIVPGVPPKRHVRVYQPTAYSRRRAPEGERPLLVLFDGQNVFGDEGSFAGGWHAHRSVERLAQRVAPPVVVGIDHGHEHRISELSPFDFPSRGGTVEGKLERFLDWIIGWLLPNLRAEHRFTMDRRRVIVGGSSMGGLAALYAALRRPDVFGGAIAMSPSLWIARGAMMRWATQNLPAAGSRIWLDCGAKEAGGRMLAATERMASILGSSPGIHLRFVADPKGQHRETDWRRRLLPALRFHYGTSRAAR